MTSSNHRSASEGVRLWEGMTGEDEGGTTITGAAEGQVPPADYKRQTVSVKMSLPDFLLNSDHAAHLAVLRRGPLLGY